MACRPPSRVLSPPGVFIVTVVLRISGDLSDLAARLEEEALYAVWLAGGNQARIGPDYGRRKRRKTPSDPGGRAGTVFEGSLQTVSSAESRGRKGVASVADRVRGARLHNANRSLIEDE